ncbi:phosphopantetheine-binding protein [Uliginosibacterium aquaticum]|uniref:Carrier domain-containing protein n=1 Tax=Uliginosibacterium aquaticum TaxID=2731212 RepID=A0ABX2IH67_9RHOO|nr:phosphopantetheine-binding protein [Uliginosibacterium aquaticum]NSL56090.1 hypothetical protein [Uliginosibacterium aquaticum]
MGLDTVELVLSVEEEFGIAIPDADACELDTPRKLADYVLLRLGETRIADPRCLSQVQFYRLRRHLVQQLGISRKSLKLDTPLDEILQGDVRKHWKMLTEICGASVLPSLGFRGWQHGVVLALDITIGLAAWQAGLSMGWVALVLGVSWLLLMAFSSSFASRIPASLQTVRDLIPYVKVSERNEWNEKEVLPRVLQLTAMQSGIELTKIQPDHHIVKDLGMD